MSIKASNSNSEGPTGAGARTDEGAGAYDFYKPQSPADFPNWKYETLDIEYEGKTQAVWMRYKINSPHSYTKLMLQEIANVRESLRALHASPQQKEWPLRYFVMASRKPDIFSFGGDLEMFAETIRSRELKELYAYGHLAIDVIYGLIVSFNLPIVTVSAVRGQCLGGGFEGALTTDYLIAEESAILGVPEIAFNSFPGMGAISLLKRRVTAALAEEIVSSGRVYSAKEMYEFGVVSHLAPNGALEATVDEWMRGKSPDCWRQRLALAEVRRSSAPISHEELIQIVELWAECSHSIGRLNLRHMERLAAAQKRKFKSPEPSPQADTGQTASRPAPSEINPND